MARNQPSYNFLTGEPSSPQEAQNNALRKTMRQSALGKTDASHEELRAQIRTLEYELSTLKQDREVAALQHEADLREVRTRADADHRRAQTAEASANSAVAKLEALSKQVHGQHETAAEERADLEKKLRRIEGQKQTLQEELDEAQERMSDLERDKGRRDGEWEGRYKALQQTYNQVKEETETKDATLHNAQQKLAQREREHEELEAELLKLRSTAGDSEALEILKRDLSEQIAHSRKLENTTREQLNELKKFRELKKSIDVVEEEKRSLEIKLRLMNDLRNELGEVKLRNDALEDEKRSWTSYLESQASGESELHFDSPEELARAFMRERLEKVALVDQLGTLQPELTVKEDEIRSLQDQKSELQKQLEAKTANGTGSAVPTVASESKAKARLERQKNLAVKETEYLRAQLKTLDAEEAEMNPARYSESQAKRVQELEGLVDSYRKEVDSLTIDMTQMETQPAAPALTSLPLGSKRPHEDTSDERLGSLTRKNKDLQASLATLQTRLTVLESDLKAKTSQLSALKSSTRYRILELRTNPTTSASTIKQATLDALRAENSTLHAQLAGALPTVASAAISADVLVPRASLSKLELALQERDAIVGSRDKSLARLKDIFRAKGLEFSEAVFSLLGWRLAFQQNGKVKAVSMFYPSAPSSAPDAEDQVEHFVEFDGEAGTMRVSGGPQSEFAREIRGQVEFWVDGKGQVPCFLAALTLEFYERYGEPKTAR